MCMCSQEINPGILSKKKMDSLLFCVNTNSFKGKYNEVINAVENNWLNLSLLSNNWNKRLRTKKTFKNWTKLMALSTYFT